ncbi:hypothetical protein IKG12_03575 [Candidatus Saccharibacteria bacterium]|nr:hypothetical protein [Candidatus Saccharibacteria bacterium]
MSKKSTKIIAAAGVVAGLGVAALPAMTFASETVNGSVDLYAEVKPAIAMTIVGNNDTNSHAGTAGTNAAVAVKAPTEATKIGNTDISSYEVTTASKASSSWVDVLPNAYVDGDDTNGFKSTITVYTNNQGGYHLAVKAPTSTALTRVGTSTQPTIPAGVPESGQATFDLEGGTAAWGYVVNTAATDGEGYSPVTTSDVDIQTTSAPTTSGDVTTVYYGVATAADQATGQYKGTITYTATTN